MRSFVGDHGGRNHSTRLRLLAASLLLMSSGCMALPEQTSWSSPLSFSHETDKDELTGDKGQFPAYTDPDLFTERYDDKELGQIWLERVDDDADSKWKVTVKVKGQRRFSVVMRSNTKAPRVFKAMGEGTFEVNAPAIRRADLFVMRDWAYKVIKSGGEVNSHKSFSLETFVPGAGTKMSRFDRKAFRKQVSGKAWNWLTGPPSDPKDWTDELDPVYEGFKETSSDDEDDESDDDSDDEDDEDEGELVPETEEEHKAHDLS